MTLPLTDPFSAARLTTSGYYELDGCDPYPYVGAIHISNTWPGHGTSIALIDAPWDTCSVSSSVTQWAYTDYLQFVPDGDNSIAVTLGIVNWSAYGIANELQGLWILGSGSSVSGPTGPVDSDQFPYWAQTIPR